MLPTAQTCFVLFQILFGGSCGLPVQHPHHYAAVHRHHAVVASIPLPRPDPRKRFTTTMWTDDPGPYPSWFHWHSKFPLADSRWEQIWRDVG